MDYYETNKRPCSLSQPQASIFFPFLVYVSEPQTVQFFYRMNDTPTALEILVLLVACATNMWESFATSWQQGELL